MRITAKGTVNDTVLEVITEGNDRGQISFLFNGEENAGLEKGLMMELEVCRPFGNYYPEVMEPLNILNTLKNFYIFDETPDIETEGVEPLEYEKGVVY